MKIEPPLGYEQITPLRKNHKVVLPRMAEEIPAVFHRLHAMPISLAEFGPASRDYPIVFVSADEGKTFSAVNLALAQSHLAESSVLLGDFDLRRPIVHNLFQIDRAPGLSDFLTGPRPLSRAMIGSA